MSGTSIIAQIFVPLRDDAQADDATDSYYRDDAQADDLCLYGFNLCLLGNFCMLFCCLLLFFKIYFSERICKENHLSVK